MESAKIEKLIRKYLDAETTIEEERLLKEYFSQNEVPLHLKEYQPIFTYFSRGIEDKSSKEIFLPRKKGKIIWWRVAAVAVLFLSIFSVYQKNVQDKKEAMLAYAETQRALQMIAFHLNKGNEAVAQLETFEKTQNKIFKYKHTK